ITDRCTYLDLAVRLALPILVVAANRLGTVNHAALTVRVATAARVRILGVVLSQPAPVADESAATNAETITAMTGLPCLAVLGHGADAAPALASLAAQV